MSPSRRRLLGTVGLALGAALVPGCAPRPASLQVGLPPWPANDLYFLADRLGHYRESSIRLVDYAAADQGLQAMRNGVIGATPCTLDEALQLAADLPDIRVIQVLDSSHGADAILANADVPSLQALRGRRIGYEATALGAYVLSRSLEIAGLGAGEITPVFVQVDEHERALREGRVDAVVTYEPVLSRLVAAGARRLFDSTQIPGEIVDVLVARVGEVERRPEPLVALVRGWFLAAEALRRQPRESAELLAPRMGLAPDAVPGAFAEIRLADLEHNRNLLSGSPPPLAAVARRLLSTMLAARFLADSPSLDALFDARIIERVSLSAAG